MGGVREAGLVLRVGTLWVVTLVALLAGAHAQPNRLAFRSDRTFKIVVFNDMHFGEEDAYDTDSLALQRNVLDAEQPDLVVFDGDLVSGWRGHNKGGWMEKQMRKILEYPNSQGYAHAIALGNHDAEADLDRVGVLKADRTISGDLSYTQIGPNDITGASNYFIDVYSGISGKSDRVDLRLWFFDSMSRGCEGEESWGCVAMDTIAWYSDLSNEMMPAAQQIAFLHIPLPEHRLGYGDFRSLGVRQEDSACPVVNTGLAKELALNGINMVVSGHDHQNDFVGNIHMIGGGTGLGVDDVSPFLPGSGDILAGDLTMLMAYGRKSGYGSYGPGGITRGARVIELKTFSTVEEEKQQTQQLVDQLNRLSYNNLSPQFMQDGAFKWMETWVTDSTGTREASIRPWYKYQVQPKCYNEAWPSLGRSVPVMMALMALMAVIATAADCML